MANANSRLMRGIKPANAGTRSLGQVVPTLRPETRRARHKRAHRFGKGFYAEPGVESKVPRSIFTPGPIVEARLTF